MNSSIDLLCPRCFVGVDDDGDGDCAFCARLSDAVAAGLRLKAYRDLQRRCSELQEAAAVVLIWRKPMPGVLLTVKKALLEEAAALRQRLDALDEALSLLNVDGE